jgi:hypothetical protein
LGFAVTNLLPEPAGRSLEDIAPDKLGAAPPEVVPFVASNLPTEPEFRTA